MKYKTVELRYWKGESLYKYDLYLKSETIMHNVTMNKAIADLNEEGYAISACFEPHNIDRAVFYLTAVLTEEEKLAHERISMKVEPKDHLFTLKEFKEECKQGHFINYDGNGFYTDGITYFWDDYVNCDDFVYDEERKGFSHVVWFNK